MLNQIETVGPRVSGEGCEELGETSTGSNIFNSAENFIPWVEKYRPKELTDIMSNEETINIIQRYSITGQMPHLLFHGPPGSGKTSSILVLAKKMYGSFRNAYVLELNASDDRGISSVREEIKMFAETRIWLGNPGEEDDSADKPKKPSVKLIILDEADQMTQAAQHALRRVMEKYCQNVRFCIICNYVNNIIPAIQSRCSRFRFTPLRNEIIAKRSKEIASFEGLNLTDTGVDALLNIAKGDMRRVLNTMQCVAMTSASRAIDDKVVFTTLGMPTSDDVSHALKVLMEKSFSQASDLFLTYRKVHGFSIQDLVSGIYERILQLDISNDVLIQLIIRLGDLEEKISAGGSDIIHSSCLISAFIEARCEADKKKSSNS